MHPTYQDRRHEVETENIFQGKKSKTPIQEMPPKNGLVHVECSITRNVTESATEAELGG